MENINEQKITMRNPKVPLIILMTLNIAVIMMSVFSKHSSAESKITIILMFLGLTTLLIATVYAAREKGIISNEEEFIIHRNIFPRIVVKKRRFIGMNDSGIFFAGKTFSSIHYENFEEIMKFIKNEIDSYSEKLPLSEVENIEKFKKRFLLWGFFLSVGMLVFLSKNHFFGLNKEVSRILILTFLALPAIIANGISNMKYKRM